jgi:hypothetical protein
VIVIKHGDGPSYTAAGQNKHIIMWKLYSFRATWDEFLEVRDASKVTRPSRLREEDEAAWDDVLELYGSRDKVTWALRMHAAGLDLTTCSEDAVAKFMDDRIFGEDSQVRRAHTVHNYCSEVRDMFRLIGREHPCGAGETMMDMTDPLGDSSNPMSTATETALIKKLQKKLVEAQAGNADSLPTAAAEKYGPPISVVIAIAFLLFFLAQLLGDFKRWERGSLRDIRPIANLANLVLLAVFLLHEASRPGDITNHLAHTDLFVPLHAKVYWLTFVFLRPATLAWLLTSNHISHVMCGLYKGKDKKTILHRMKTVIPCAYNSFDLLTIYIICMRCIVSLSPALLTPLVFKAGLNLFSLRRRLTEGTLFRWIRFYSWRYGAAEEDKNGNIDATWTRRRMGHSDKSDMKDKYADNAELRPLVGEDVLPLGLDTFSRPSNPSVIPLEFNVTNTGIVYDTTWLAKAFTDAPDGLRADFEKTAALVTRFLENNDQAAKDELFESIAADGTKWYSQIPLGFHYVLPASLGSPALFATIKSSMTTLQGFFVTPQVPRAVPEIWSLPMLLYGNFRGLLGLSRVPLEQPVAPPADTAAAAPSAPGPSKPPASRKRPAPKPTPDSDEEWDGEKFADLDVGDIVAIKSNSPTDPTTFKVPNLEPTQYIWLAKMTKEVNVTQKKTAIKRGKFTGRFLFNATRDLTASSFQIRPKPETITIAESALIEVYEDDPATFKLTSEDIAALTTFLREHM